MNARDRAKFRRLCEERGPLVMASFERPLTRQEKARRKAIERELNRLERPDHLKSMARLRAVLRRTRRMARQVTKLVADLEQHDGTRKGEK